ncbi:MAG: hypothetical protein QF365_01690 [Candidatus Thalassarchaeaceae archaeon]|jgi:hypothetical protein|nr:hypothetical protein [Candidatus Thalassarchaeaceae archaeon]HJN70543.1 hypothetical protein [Candidatus Thalassarchaeaceae archaeon]
MNMDMDAMKAEIGGAFVMSYVVFGMGLSTLEGAVAMAVVWMTFAGAHVLPVVTWCHMLTGELDDVEGNWMANGMRLLAQVVGGVLAILMVTEVGAIETGWAATEFAAPEAWPAITTVAAGALWWYVHSNTDSAWVSAFGLMALGGAMMLTGGHEMAASAASSFDGIADVAPAWILDGILVGVGALVGSKVDEMM